MKALLLLALLLCSCAGGAKMAADGSVTVYGPFMARADRLAVNAKTATGTLKVLLVNGNAESVPNNAINAITSGMTLKAGVKYNDNQTSTNNLKVQTNGTAHASQITPEGVIVPPTFAPQQ